MTINHRKFLKDSAAALAASSLPAASNDANKPYPVTPVPQFHGIQPSSAIVEPFPPAKAKHNPERSEPNNGARRGTAGIAATLSRRRRALR